MEAPLPQRSAKAVKFDYDDPDIFDDSPYPPVVSEIARTLSAQVRHSTRRASGSPASSGAEDANELNNGSDVNETSTVVSDRRLSREPESGEVEAGESIRTMVRWTDEEVALVKRLCTAYYRNLADENVPRTISKAEHWDSVSKEVGRSVAACKRVWGRVGPQAKGKRTSEITETLNDESTMSFASRSASPDDAANRPDSPGHLSTDAPVVGWSGWDNKELRHFHQVLSEAFSLRDGGTKGPDFWASVQQKHNAAGYGRTVSACISRWQSLKTSPGFAELRTYSSKQNKSKRAARMDESSESEYSPSARKSAPEPSKSSNTTPTSGRKRNASAMNTDDTGLGEAAVQDGSSVRKTAADGSRTSKNPKGPDVAPTSSAEDTELVRTRIGQFESKIQDSQQKRRSVESTRNKMRTQIARLNREAKSIEEEHAAEVAKFLAEREATKEASLQSILEKRQLATTQEEQAIREIEDIEREIVNHEKKKGKWAALLDDD